MPEENKKTIMEIVSEMVREGESEEKIVETLKSLGVNDAEIHRLLLVAQAHTFELLRGEIDKIVESHISEKRPGLKEMIRSQISQAAEQTIADAQEKIMEQKVPEAQQAATVQKEGEKARANKNKMAESIAAAKEAPKKAADFISSVFSKVFKKKEREKTDEKKDSSFITPETAEWRAIPELEKAPLQELFVKKEEPKEAVAEKTEPAKEGEAAKKEETKEIEDYDKVSARYWMKLKSLEAWQTRYRKQLANLKRRRDLTEKQIAKKVGLKTKVRSYGLKIGEMKRTISGKTSKQAKARFGRQVQGTMQAGMQQAFVAGQPVFAGGYPMPSRQGLSREESVMQLKTAQDLVEAAKAITFAAEKIVELAPRQKITVSEKEEELTIDQEIEKTKRMKKLLEVDFYKRRLTLPDFQKKMIEYQGNLYEFEEKRRILQENKAAIEKKAAEQKEEEPKKTGFFPRAEKTVEERMGSRLSPEKVQEMQNYASELVKKYNIPEHEARGEVGKSDIDSALSGFKRIENIAGLEEEAKNALADLRQERQEFREEKKKASFFSQPWQFLRGQQPTEQKTETQSQATRQQAEMQMPRAQEQQWETRRQQQQEFQQQMPEVQIRGQEKPIIVKAPRPQKIVIEEEAPQVEVVREQSPVGVIRREEETERVVLRAIEGPKRYVKAPSSEEKRVIIEQEKGWSEAELPSYPETGDKTQIEKVKTILREIDKVRIITDLDRVLQAIKEKGIINITQLNKDTGIEKQRLQELVEILEGHKLAKIEYATFGEERVMDINYAKPKPLEKQKSQIGKPPMQQPKKAS